MTNTKRAAVAIDIVQVAIESASVTAIVNSIATTTMIIEPVIDMVQIQGDQCAAVVTAMTVIKTIDTGEQQAAVLDHHHHLIGKKTFPILTRMKVQT
jgi:hypothetical protein